MREGELSGYIAPKKKNQKESWTQSDLLDQTTFFQLNTSFSEFKDNWLPTAGPIDGPTDGQKNPLIEMRRRI